VDEGRAILARLEPEYEYDLDADGHNERLPLSYRPDSRWRRFDLLRRAPPPVVMGELFIHDCHGRHVRVIRFNKDPP
jgi:hypothetical protein